MHKTTVTCKIKVVQPDITALAFKKTEVTVEQGKTYQSKISVTPKNVTSPKLSWETSAKEVATVDANGKVTAVAPGTATITAMNGDLSASYDVTVTRADLKSISFKEKQVNLTCGETYKQDVVTDPTGFSNDEFSWQSMNGDVATVAADGTVTAGNKPGNVAIYASYIDQKLNSTTATDYYLITVSLGKIEDFSFNEAAKNIMLGNTFTPTVNTTPSGYGLSDFTWTSSNASVATVDGNGNVRGIGSGSANITASRDGISRSFTITVTGNTLTADKTAVNLVCSSYDDYNNTQIIHVTNLKKTSLTFNTMNAATYGAIACEWVDRMPNTVNQSKDGAESADLIVRAYYPTGSNITGSAVNVVNISDGQGSIISIPVYITYKNTKE